MQDNKNQHILFSKSNTAKQHEKLGKLLEKYPYSLNLQYKYLESALSLGLPIEKSEFKRLSAYAIDKPFFNLKFKKLNRQKLKNSNSEDNEERKVEVAPQQIDEQIENKAISATNLIQDIPVKQDVNEQKDMMAPKKDKKKDASQAPEATPFTEWLEGLKKSKRLQEEAFEAPTDEEGYKMKKKKKKKSKKKKKQNKYLKFGSKQDEIISETLAELMAKQGYTDKAIEMYNRLSLLFPDKNTYFARKIEELRK